MTSKYDMRSNPVYQIDWASAASGKRVSATKRRVRFRFGFSSATAIANGLTGIQCRGEEHEVNLIWSLTSGKRQVYFDGKEVHFSKGRRGEAKFEASWSIQGGHMLKIIAHAGPPLRVTPGFKQYDLVLDGMSFFDMPRMFELGVKNHHHGRPVATALVGDAHNSSNNYYNNYAVEEEHYSNSPSRHYEEERTINNSFPSIEPAPHGFAGPSRRKTADQLEQAPAPTRSSSAPTVVPPQDVLSEAPHVSDFLETPISTYTNTVDEFTPVQIQPQPPTFQDVSNQILSAYGPAPTPAPALALANESHTHFQNQMPTQGHSHYPPQQQPQQYALAPAINYHHNGHHQNHHQQQTYYAPQSAVVSPISSNSAPAGFYSPYQAPATPNHHTNTPQPDDTEKAPMVVTPTMMKPLELDELRDSPPPADLMDQAVQNLVNLNDLNEIKATPEQIKARKQKEAVQKQHPKSNPKPPAATDWHVGQNASLLDIQKYKKPTAPPAKEVMKMHAFDPAAAQAGMMVIYGQPQPQQGALVGGIPAASGFGAGMAYHRGYAQPLRSAF